MQVPQSWLPGADLRRTDAGPDQSPRPTHAVSAQVGVLVRCGAVRVLGVDEFPLLKGHNHATLPVDLQARRPIDVLPGREAETVAGRLEDHPEVEIVCSDRASADTEESRAAAPQAVQIAVVRHLAQPRQSPGTNSRRPLRLRPCRLRCRQAVRRYARTTNVDELLVKVTQRRTLPDDNKPNPPTNASPRAAATSAGSSGRMRVNRVTWAAVCLASVTIRSDRLRGRQHRPGWERNVRLYRADASALAWRQQLRAGLALDEVAAGHPDQDNTTGLDALAGQRRAKDWVLQDRVRGEEEFGKVIAATYHAAKGREFDTLFCRASATSQRETVAETDRDGARGTKTLLLRRPRPRRINRDHENGAGSTDGRGRNPGPRPDVRRIPAVVTGLAGGGAQIRAPRTSGSFPWGPVYPHVTDARAVARASTAR
ncbi:transposase [Streptomyces gardneri]|uniref:transposase n=1 Tax=Streptomyces gardneri TaxID=66892 RepID=UPI0036C975A8